MSINAHMAIVGVSLVCTVSQAGPPPPNALRVCGLYHEGLGIAAIFGQDLDGNGGLDRLTIANIGSSGQDGVSISLGSVPAGDEAPGLSPSGWSGDIDFGPAGDLSPGLSLTITARDQQGNPIPMIAISETNNGDAAVTLAQPCVNCTVRVQAYHNGIRVADLDGDGLSPIVATGPIGSITPAPAQGGGAIAIPINLTKNNYKRHHGHVTILKLAGPTTTGLSGGGLPGVSVLCDTIEVEVHHVGEVDDVINAVDITAANTGGTSINIQQEAVLTRNVAISALNEAYLDGVQDCSGVPPVCENLLEVSNIGSSGQDGVSIIESPYLREGGHTVGAGQAIEIRAKTMDPGDELDHCIEGRLIDEAAPVLVCSKAIGAPGGALNIEISDSSTGSDQWVAQVYRLGIPVVPAGQPATGPPMASVSGFPPGIPPAITGFGMSRHMGGEHMMGAMWKFASDCRITLAGGVLVMGDEIRIIRTTALPLKREEGGRHTPFHNKAVIAGAKVELTEIEPAQMGFSNGYAFGLQHQAIGGAQLFVRDFSTIDNAPEEKERGITVSNARGGGGGGGGGGVQIVLGQAEGLRIRMEDIDLAGLDSEGVGTAKSAAPGNRDVYVWKIKKAPAAFGPPAGVEITTDFTAAGSTQQTISLYLDGALVTSLSNQPNNTAVMSSGQPQIVENRKGLSSIVTGGEGEIRFEWDFGTEMQVGGQLHTADTVVCRADSPTNTDPLAYIDLTMEGELTDFTLTDEALIQFDLYHTGHDAAQILGVPGSTGSALQVLNPSSNTQATMASQIIRHTYIGVQNYHKDWGHELTVDRCAGLPEPCGIPDGASLASTALITLPQGEQQATVEVINSTGGTLASASSINASFAELGYTTFTVEVLNGNTVIGTIQGHSGPIAATCDVCDAPWPQNLRWNLDTAANRTFATLTFADEHQFDVGGASHMGDGLRLIVPAVVGFYRHELRTIDVPEVIITSVTLIDETQPICRADIAPVNGNGTVGVPDLLTVINGWGPCPAPPASCPADIAPEPSGDGTIGVPDLLYIINNWGPCP